MRQRLEQLRSAILSKLPASRLEPLTESELGQVLLRHPNLPDHLRQLFTVLGAGVIGDSRYAIHALLDPAEVYDAETARGLDGVVLVGDDFAGTCDAYDTKRGWKFGSIGASGEFTEADGDLIDFLESWYGDATD